MTGECEWCCLVINQSSARDRVVEAKCLTAATRMWYGAEHSLHAAAVALQRLAMPVMDESRDADVLYFNLFSRLCPTPHDTRFVWRRVVSLGTEVRSVGLEEVVDGSLGHLIIFKSDLGDRVCVYFLLQMMIQSNEQGVDLRAGFSVWSVPHDIITLCCMRKVRARNRTATRGRDQVYHWPNLLLIQPRGAANYSYWLIFIFPVGSKPWRHESPPVTQPP